MANSSLYSKFVRVALCLAFFVVLLGAYTRLSDAGLGCPDWPGCYGKLVVPHAVPAVEAAQKAYPSIPLETPKAWAEMVHRYFAGSLGLFIFGLAIWSTARRYKNSSQPIVTPWLLVGIVIFQAALGMWTVTLKLLPDVVSAHLLGGMLITALLYWLKLSSQYSFKLPAIQLQNLRPWVLTGLVLLFGQIFLGAWTSTNYAALACPHFPLCNASLFPQMEWAKAFNFLSPIGPNYEGGQLDMLTRATIQMSHRYGAFIVFCYLSTLGVYMIRKSALRRIGISLLILLFVQIILGVLNVELRLPIQTAVMHNGVALLLLLTMVAAVYRSYYIHVEAP